MLFHRDPRLRQMLVEHLKENGLLLCRQTRGHRAHADLDVASALCAAAGATQWGALGAGGGDYATNNVRRHAGTFGSDVGLMRSHVDKARRNRGHAGDGSEGVRVRGGKSFGEQLRSSHTQFQPR
jgi:hypothetical protein